MIKVMNRKITRKLSEMLECKPEDGRPDYREGDKVLARDLAWGGWGNARVTEVEKAGGKWWIHVVFAAGGRCETLKPAGVRRHA